MDHARYYVALMLPMTLPGGILYWFSIHPFISFWRKLGVPVTLALHAIFLALLASLAFALRKPLLSIQFGTQAWLIVPAALLFGLSIALRIGISRHLTGRILVGIPEMSPDQSPAPLLTKGPFARVRNPRYLQILVVVLACALFSNYLASYIVFAASVIGLRVVIWMEEKELHKRYGKDYEEYCARVPRLLPRLHAEASR